MNYSEIKEGLKLGKQRKKEFEMSEAGMLFKEHEKVFGEEPRFIGLTNPSGGETIALIKNALATGKPLRGYDDLPDDLKKQFDKGNLIG